MYIIILALEQCKVIDLPFSALDISWIIACIGAAYILNIAGCNSACNAQTTKGRLADTTSLPLIFLCLYCYICKAFMPQNVTAKQVLPFCDAPYIPDQAKVSRFVISLLLIQTVLHINHLVPDYFLCPTDDAVHGLNPFPLRPALQIFIYALGSGHLLDDKLAAFLCLLVEVGKVGM